MRKGQPPNFPLRYTLLMRDEHYKYCWHAAHWQHGIPVLGRTHREAASNSFSVEREKNPYSCKCMQICVNLMRGLDTFFPLTALMFALLLRWAKLFFRAFTGGVIELWKVREKTLINLEDLTANYSFMGIMRSMFHFFLKWVVSNALLLMSYKDSNWIMKDPLFSQ